MPRRSKSTKDPLSPSRPAEGPEESHAEQVLRDFAERFVTARREEVERIPVWLAEGQYALIARTGHQIKGTAPTFGLPEIGVVGARLEAAAKAEDTAAVEAELKALRRLLDTG